MKKEPKNKVVSVRMTDKDYKQLKSKAGKDTPTKYLRKLLNADRRSPTCK